VVGPTADLECDRVDVVLASLALDNAADKVLLTSLKFEAEELGELAVADYSSSVNFAGILSSGPVLASFS
jgi:hypothetical protein